MDETRISETGINSENFLRVGVMRMNKKGFWHPQNTTCAMFYTAKQFNIDLCLFSPEDVNFEKKTVKAEFLVENDRVVREVPIPRIIENSVSSAKGVIEFITRLENEAGCFLTRHPLYKNKQQVYDMLLERGNFKEFLIESHIIDSFEQFLDLLQKYYGDVILKPLRGARGIGVARIQLKDDRFLLNFLNQKADLNLNEFRSFYNEHFTSRKHILQPYIVSRTRNGNPFDIRVHCRRGAGGKFKVSPFPRIGNAAGVVSNIATGGYSMKLGTFLQVEFGDDWKFILSKLQEFGNAFPEYYQSFYKVPLFDIGVDMGIQKRGDHYDFKIFEVNTYIDGPFFEIEDAITYFDYFKYVDQKLKQKNQKKNSERLLVKNYDTWNKIESQNFFSEQNLSVKTVENGIILPPKIQEGKHLIYNGGVVTPDLKFVAGYERSDPSKNPILYTLRNSYTVEQSEIEQYDESVIFCGLVWGHFGHVMIESFCRMWYVLQHSENHDRLVFLHVGPWKIQDWLYQFFELMDIPKDRIMIVEKPTQFKSIIIPDQSARIGFDYHREYSIPYETMIKKVESMNIPTHSKKIFLTRTKGKNTDVVILNVEYFEKFYASQGYEIIEPENLSLPEQISLVHNADKISAFFGTLSHWAVFCKPKTKFDMLMRCNTETRTIQSVLNDFRKIDWYFVDVSKDFLFDGHGYGIHLLGNTSYWQKYIKDHFGIETADDDEISSGLIFDYMSLYMQKHDRLSREHSYFRSFLNLYAQNKILEKQVEINRPVICYETHVSMKGTLPICVENDIAGYLDKNYSIEAVKIYFSELIHDLFYAVCYENGTWTDEVKSPNFAGSIGKRRGICGIKIRLDDQSSKQFNIRYRLHNFEGTWSNWVENGSEVQFEKPVVNAIQIELI